MKSSTNTHSSVSERSKKQEILDAYQDLLTKVQSGPIATETVEKIERVNKEVKTNLLTIVDTAHGTFLEAVNTLNEQMASATKVLEELRLAAEIQQKRIAQERQEESEKRSREEEEYAYEFGKRQNRQEEELAEGKRKAEANIRERQEEIQAQQEELIDLRDQIKTFEVRLAKAVSDAVASATKELKNQFEYEKVLANTQAQSAQSLLSQQVELLTSTVADQKKEMDRLNKALVEAGARVTRIAERAVSRNENPVMQTNSIEKQ